jgi:ribosome-binding factor A
LQWQKIDSPAFKPQKTILSAVYSLEPPVARTQFNRTDRIGALLRREVAVLVHHDVREGLVPEMSVSDVEVSRDLAHATIFVTALKSEDSKAGIKLLNEQAKGYRMFLAKSLGLRMMPALHFKYDDSVDRGERIETLLRGEA